MGCGLLIHVLSLAGDMRDAQIENNLAGLLPDVAPDGTGLGDPMQTAAFVLLVDWLHQHYSAVSLVEEHYDALAEYMAGLARYINTTTHIIPSRPLSHHSPHDVPSRRVEHGGGREHVGVHAAA